MKIPPFGICIRALYHHRAKSIMKFDRPIKFPFFIQQQQHQQQSYDLLFWENLFAFCSIC